MVAPHSNSGWPKLFLLLLIVVALLAGIAWFLSGQQADAQADRCAPSFAPPAAWNGYTARNISTSGGSVNLDPNTDYKLIMPSSPVRNRLAIVGGRNVVLIGGEINISDKSSTASISERNALLVRDSTCVVHIEGVYMYGNSLSEAIQVDAPLATVQLVNIRVEGIRARDQVNFTDNHPDLIQTYGNARHLYVDGFTGSTDYQGIFLSADYDKPHGSVYIRNVNVRPNGDHGRYLFWISDRSAGPYRIENVWVQPSPQRVRAYGGNAFLKTTWPESNRNVGTDEVGRFAEWPDSQVFGRVYEGVPPGGDFVTRDMVGIGYTRDQIPPTDFIEPTLTPSATALPPTLEPTPVTPEPATPTLPPTPTDIPPETPTPILPTFEPVVTATPMYKVCSRSALHDRWVEVCMWPIELGEDG